MLQPLQLSRTHVTSTNDKDPALQLVICSRMGREQSLLLFLGFLRWWGGEPLMYVRTSPPPEPSTCSWLYPSFLHYLVTPAFTVIRHSPPLLKESAGPPPQWATSTWERYLRHCPEVSGFCPEEESRHLWGWALAQQSMNNQLIWHILYLAEKPYEWEQIPPF